MPDGTPSPTFTLADAVEIVSGSSQSQPSAGHQRSVLLDSRDYSDARIMGYDGERDPREDGEGLIVENTSSALVPEITMNGPDGEIRLCGLAEIEEVAKVLASFVERRRETGRAA